MIHEQMVAKQKEEQADMLQLAVLQAVMADGDSTAASEKLPKSEAADGPKPQLPTIDIDLPVNT